MTDYQAFIDQVFTDQYEEQFGAADLEHLQAQDIYLKREVGGHLAALLHAQQVLENIHVKALVVAQPHQGHGLGAGLLSELEEEARKRQVTSITLSTKSYQAKDFYLKQGYEIYASLEDVPQKGVVKYHLIKRINPKNT